MAEKINKLEDRWIRIIQFENKILRQKKIYRSWETCGKTASVSLYIRSSEGRENKTGQKNNGRNNGQKKLLSILKILIYLSTNPRSSTNLKQDKHKQIHTQTNHAQMDESQRKILKGIWKKKSNHCIQKNNTIHS